MVKAYELVNHIIDTGEIFSTLSYSGKSFHIVRQYVSDKGTHIIYESIDIEPKEQVEIFLSHSIDDKLLVYRRLRNDIEDGITIRYKNSEEVKND